MGASIEKPSILLEADVSRFTAKVGQELHRWLIKGAIELAQQGVPPGSDVLVTVAHVTAWANRCLTEEMRVRLGVPADGQQRQQQTPAA